MKKQYFFSFVLAALSFVAAKSLEEVGVERYYFQKAITRAIDDGIYPITKSKFPILFNKEHDKLKQMLFSSDYETFNLARKIIKQQKLI